MSANLICKAFEQPTSFSVAESEVLNERHVNRPMYYMENPYATGSSNANMRLALSVKPTADLDAGAFHVYIEYKDAANKSNYSTFYNVACPGGKWTRLSGNVTVPSGMTVVVLAISVYKACTFDVTDFELWDGTDAIKAVASHTPYATQDHVAAEYSTKASQKILSDSITSEVKARAKTDGAVSELSSKMEQTVNGINVSLDKLTATEKQIHSWFDFGSDASGNPKLAMGSSSSPIIGEYSNTGTTYKDRSGATLLALDAANSTTGADHVVAKDMTVGKWKWVPTNGGDNLTLVWIGG